MTSKLHSKHGPVNAHVASVEKTISPLTGGRGGKRKYTWGILLELPRALRVSVRVSVCLALPLAWPFLPPLCIRHNVGEGPRTLLLRGRACPALL